jgi:SAM-dependent methyltransferase
MSYQHMATVYDQLMRDAPYDRWLAFIAENRLKYASPTQSARSSIVDLGCGTGTLSILLAKDNYDVTGIDLAAEMLAVAAEKSNAENVPVQWLQQDMTELNLGREVDLIICFCDSLNYVLKREDVGRMFQSVHRHLLPGGLFLFDTHSEYQMREVFGSHRFAQNDDPVSLIWHCEYDEQSRIVEHDLTFFVQRSDQLYSRFDETHRQAYYSVAELDDLLRTNGLELLETSADFGTSPPNETSERLFYVAKKHS